MNSKLLQIIVEICIVNNGLLQLRPPDVFFYQWIGILFKESVLNDGGF